MLVKIWRKGILDTLLIKSNFVGASMENMNITLTFKKKLLFERVISKG